MRLVKRWPTIGLLLSMMFSVFTHAAAADPGNSDPTCEKSQLGNSLYCHYESGEVTPGTQAVTLTGSSSGSTTKYVPYDRLTTAPDGTQCVATAWYPEGETPPDQAPSIVPEGGPLVGTEDNSNLYHTYPPCPNQPAPPAGAEETPESIAARYWETIPLPRPKPSIAPGWAITGKLAYLETNNETTHTYTNGTTIGPLQIVATGTYYVDWGDGQTSGPHRVEGKAWPEGEITHEYIWARQYDVVVTERWTATWSLGGKSGTLRELHTTGEIPDFPARQIQAVIR